MRNETKWIVGSVLTAVAIYLISPIFNSFPSHPTNWELQTQFMYLSGMCSLTLMVTSMLVSLRLPKINSLMGGLDKAYVVHKWTGIFTSAFVFFHWLGDKIPLLLITLNIIPDPRLLVDITQYSKTEIISYKLGLTCVEIFFYVLTLLVFASLYHKIPYRLFRKTHKFIPAIFLIFAFHSVTVPIKEHGYRHVGIYPLLLIIFIGCVISLIALFQQIGRSRKITAVIKKIEDCQNNILHIHLQTLNKPFIHKAGQFAFFQFEHDKEPHPFSIASSSGNPETFRIAIKPLGDFTEKLLNELEPGQKVNVEGPYGEFKFEDNSKRQIWIAGGIGITPFLAQLEYLSRQPEKKQNVDFWYCTRGNPEDQFPLNIRELCQEACVNFCHLNTEKESYLNLSTITAKVDDLSDASVWFCGPRDFSESLKKEFKSAGFDMSKFHYDNFSMR